MSRREETWWETNRSRVNGPMWCRASPLELKEVTLWCISTRLPLTSPSLWQSSASEIWDTTLCSDLKDLLLTRHYTKRLSCERDIGLPSALKLSTCSITKCSVIPHPISRART